MPLPQYWDSRTASVDPADLTSAAQAGKLADWLGTLFLDPKEGVLTALTGGNALPLMGGVALGGVLGRTREPSRQMVAAAKAIINNLGRTERGAPVGADPYDLARTLDSVVGSALAKYVPKGTVDIRQAKGKPGEFIVNRNDLSQAALAAVQKVLPGYNIDAPVKVAEGQIPQPPSLFSYLWNPVKQAVDEEARKTLAKTTLPHSESLEMEAARIRKLYQGRKEDVAVQNILDELKTKSPKGMRQPGVEADVGRFLEPGQDVPVQSVAEVLPSEEPDPSEALSRMADRLKLLTAFQTKLTPRQQAIMSMAHDLSESGQAMTYQQIGKALAGPDQKGLSPTMVMNEIKKSKLILAKELGQPLVDPASLTEGSRDRLIGNLRQQLSKLPPTEQSTLEQINQRIDLQRQINQWEDRQVSMPPPHPAGVQWPTATIADYSVPNRTRPDTDIQAFRPGMNFKGASPGASPEYETVPVRRGGFVKDAEGKWVPISERTPGPVKQLDPNAFEAVRNEAGQLILVPKVPPISGGAGGQWNESRTPEPVLRQLRSNMVEMLGGKYPPQEPDPKIVEQLRRAVGQNLSSPPGHEHYSFVPRPNLELQTEPGTSGAFPMLSVKEDMFYDPRLRNTQSIIDYPTDMAVLHRLYSVY